MFRVSKLLDLFGRDSPPRSELSLYCVRVLIYCCQCTATTDKHNLTNAVVYAATTMTGGVRSRLPHNAKHSTSIYDDRGHVEFDRTACFARQLYVQCAHADGEGLYRALGNTYYFIELSAACAHGHGLQLGYTLGVCRH